MINFSLILPYVCILFFSFLTKEEARGQQESYSLQPYMDQRIDVTQEKGIFPEEVQKKKLQIGLFQDPPFSFQKKDGTWQGIAVDIFKKIALANDLQYDFVPLSKEGQPFSPQDLRESDFSKYDVILWSVPDVILKKGYTYDYSLPYYVGGIVVVQKKVATTLIDMLLHALSSEEFITTFSLLCFYMIIGMFLMWFFERKQKDTPFKKDIKGGLWDSFWWCTSLTSTIYPCELYPKSLGGRVLSIIWMFLSITIFWGFIGTISSSLTVNRIKTPVQELKSLSSLKICAVKNSSTEIFLKNNMLSYKTVENIETGLDKVQKGENDAFIGPEPLVRYYLKNNNQYDDLIISPISFSTQYYSFIVSLNSPLLHPLNYEVLRIINTYFWKQILFEYMGHIPTIH